MLIGFLENGFSVHVWHDEGISLMDYDFVKICEPNSMRVVQSYKLKDCIDFVAENDRVVIESAMNVAQCFSLKST